MKRTTLVVCLVAALIVDINAHGWMQVPQPRSGGGATQENASTQSPCGQTGSESSVATYAASSQITVETRRGGGHTGTGPDTVEFILSYSGDAAADFTGPLAYNLGTYDHSVPGPHSFDLTLPPNATAMGETAVLRFNWRAGDGSSWWDCAYVTIASIEDYCTPITGQADRNDCPITSNCNNDPASATGYTCTCPIGTSGDGYVCTDIDECVEIEDACDPKADCFNSDGDFSCFCKANFVGDGTFNYCWASMTIRLATFVFDFDAIAFKNTLATSLGINADRIDITNTVAGGDYDGGATTMVTFHIKNEGDDNGEAASDELYQFAADDDTTVFGYAVYSFQGGDYETFDVTGELCETEGVECVDRTSVGDGSSVAILIIIIAGGVVFLAAVGIIIFILVKKRDSLSCSCGCCKSGDKYATPYQI